MKFSSEFEKNVSEIRSRLPLEKSFDILERNILIHNKKAYLIFLDGLTKDDALRSLMKSIYFLKEDIFNTLKTSKDFIEKVIPNIEVAEETDFDKIINSLLCGQTIIIIEGYNSAIILDIRTYPARGPEEPDKEKVLRGARDGFVETIVFNTALIRRRIRDTNLTFEMTTIGSSSKTDVAIGYMSNLVNKKALDTLKKRLNSLKVDALTMGDESLVESLNSNNWFNPFPKVRYTERPDVTAAHILEGKIIILVDNNPTAILVPTCIFDFFENIEDYYFPILTGNYLRIIRNFIFLAQIFITPCYLLLVQYQNLIPTSLKFLLPSTSYTVPLILQFLLLELAIDGLKLASLNTPSSLGMSLSVIGALLLGEYTVNTGWLIPETILYMAIVALASFTQPSIELSYAIKFLRIMILILTGLFGIWGFIIGIILSIIIIASTKTLTGESYLYPLIPFNGSALRKLLFRSKIKSNKS